ncbi:hypothetical protein FA048_16755 [Pedobacter polaris]|uniref:Uncharacterized protein n=1 Tax=Pedobacter polaris TaxID=2571273 RepID=A0A4U1CFI0_9SPHI|nr:DUF6660 family protein [Pedobacter polaris]TKC05379.1 hypothetical protein FA048_16755 [Pedobacter polaris]
MKNLGIFYLIMVVLLSALPCSDELENKDFVENTSAIISHEKDDCKTESCSPICLCTCCGQSVIETDLVSFTTKILATERPSLISAYHFKLEQRDQNIWQPPKLV